MSIFDILFNKAPLGLTIWDINLIYVKVNNNMVKMDGIPRKAHIGKPVDIVLPSMGIKQAEYIQRVLKTGRAVLHKEINGRIPGTTNISYWRTSYFPLKRDKHIIAVAGICEDITERKLTRDYLQYAAQINQSISDAVIATNLDNIISRWNIGAQQLYGWTELEALGRNAAKLIPTKYTDSTRKSFRSSLRNEGFWKGEVVQKTKFGNEVVVLASVSAVKDKKNKPVGMVAVNRDISEIKRREKELQKIQERYKVFVMQSNLGIARFELRKPLPITYKSEKQIRLLYRNAFLAECNDTLAKMYSFASQERMLGKKINDIYPLTSGDWRDCMIQFVSADYNLVNAELLINSRKLNKYFVVNLVGIVKGEKLIRIWGTQMDVTERKRLEKQKDEFVGIASHELKTPLTTIKAYTQVLQKNLATQKKESDLLERMNTQVNKITGLIEDFFDVAKIEAGRLELNRSLFKINDLLESTIKDIRRTNKTHKIIVTTNETVEIFADKERLEQVIVNLVLNAIKYSPASKEVHVVLKKSNKRVTINVKDFGIGIKKSNIKQIFNKFFRAEQEKGTHYSGMGLGLFIVREIIERHNGQIKVKSIAGKGSTFSFWLPITAS